MVKHMLDCHPERSEGSRSTQDVLLYLPATRFFALSCSQYRVAPLLRMTGTPIRGVQHVVDWYDFLEEEAV